MKGIRGRNLARSHCATALFHTVATYTPVSMNGFPNNPSQRKIVDYPASYHNVHWMQERATERR